MEEQLILVNDQDLRLGVAEKLQAHKQGWRHRAFSIFIYNPEGKMLLQRRAETKYHSAGLWANSCCGHPRPHESVEEAASRRLKEELGFSCSLEFIQCVSYTLSLENTLHENEYTHIFKGTFEGEATPCPLEVQEIAWETPKEILLDALANKHLYARWFRLYLFKYFNRLFEK